MSINLERLREVAEGDANFIRELLTVFLKDSAAKMAALGGAIQRGEAVQVYELAHQLKGSSANVGAARLTAQARELEELGRKGAISEARQRFAQLSEELDTVRRELEAVIAQQL